MKFSEIAVPRVLYRQPMGLATAKRTQNLDIQ
jgi:hypothetical protein